ncbi:MAG: hypothetical protein MZU91_08970 [Desulfosudis oleivorans]|nr:hypothetical protein [Desulfosudis oleivorans]
MRAPYRIKKGPYRSLHRGQAAFWDTDPDIVAVTHGHADHLGETVALGKKTVAITEIAKYLKTKGLACRRYEYRGYDQC